MFHLWRKIIRIKISQNYSSSGTTDFLKSFKVIPTMYFDHYKEHPEARIRPSLLWEYDLTCFDWKNMKNIVLQRVIERGRISDFYAAMNLYGFESFIDGIKDIPHLNKKDISFVCTVFGIKKHELKCYTHKQLHPKHSNF